MEKNLRMLANKLIQNIEWSKLEYEENYDDFNIENNILGNVRSHKDTFYVCIPRWRDGVPATLNTLKVSYFQNESMKSSFLPKYERKIVRISALCSEGRNPHKFILKITDT